MSDFQWDGDDADSVILPHQPRTAVYGGRAGHVVVRQEADAHEEYDPQLLFTPQGALAIAWAMIEQAQLIGLPQPTTLAAAIETAAPPEALPHDGVVTTNKSPEPPLFCVAAERQAAE